LQIDRDAYCLLFVARHLRWGTPLGTGRLIVVCFPIQKRRQVYQEEILNGWERSLQIDVEAAA
jgi:hypothetical protein